MQLNGKTIYITGGTGGIGSALVPLLIKAGAEVTLFERRKDGDLVKNVDHICEQLRINPPDILINMAGHNDFDFCENQKMDELIALNLTVPMRLTQAVLPHMKACGAGQIVNIGSMLAVIPLPHFSGYVAAKAGLKGFSDSLRRELMGSNIIVTHIMPRAVATSMNHGLKGELNAATNTAEDDPNVVAMMILQAIIKQKTELRIGWPERLFAHLHTFIPSFIDKGLKKNAAIGQALLNKNQKTVPNEEKTHEKNITTLNRVAS